MRQLRQPCFQEPHASALLLLPCFFNRGVLHLVALLDFVILRNVPPAAQGGTIARSEHQRRNASFYFCSGINDPWFKILSAKSLVVFDATWIKKCVREQFRVPIAPYALDEHCEASGPSHAQGRSSMPKSVVISDPCALSKRGTLPHGKRRIDDLSSPEPADRPQKRARRQLQDLVSEVAPETDLLKPPASPRKPLICASQPSKLSVNSIKHLDLSAELSRMRQKYRPRSSTQATRVLQPIASPVSRLIEPRPSKLIGSLASKALDGLAAAPKDSWDLAASYLTAPFQQAPGLRRVPVDVMLDALAGVAIADTCIFEPGKRHLGEDFHLLALRRSPGQAL
ncbi:hypothetical protein BV25DRAFT_1703497 [Artomyces pyxidatus]|uniref:Uncharacterized protein n=1 Tax=Artomyces pyxidatus TaxID=48021 RepID=A0ACB8TAJ3_9AGAM|nr:hypothetical protein BV25DRAFT_1703497 [Artomyces pyxidatus]